MVLKRKAKKALELIADANMPSKAHWKGWSDGGKNGLMEFVGLLVNVRCGKAPV